MEVKMKSLPLVVAIAALSLGSYVTAAEAAAETKVVHIGKRYSKVALDRICARECGSAYGTAQDLYGCAKDGNVVACNADGICNGYIWLSTTPAAEDANDASIRDWHGSAELVLQ